MSRIDELIAELCPDGVPHKTLGELGQFKRGRRFTKADVVEDGIPSLHYGDKPRRSTRRSADMSRARK